MKEKILTILKISFTIENVFQFYGFTTIFGYFYIFFKFGAVVANLCLCKSI